MKISVITPCYNSESYIEETIESVLSQRGRFEIEYIIVDGGSTDKTISVIEKWKGLVESGGYTIKCSKVNFHFISEKDEGMYEAIVKGFELATGDILAYINSDDFYLPNAFSAMSEIFEKYPDVDWITGVNVGYNTKGQVTDCLLPFKYKNKFVRRGIYGTILPFIQQESTCWRRKLIIDLDFERLKQYKFAGDFYMWYTFSKKADLHIAQGCLAGFRSHGGQVSKQRNKYLKEFNSIAERKGFGDAIVAYGYKVVTYFTPNVVKRILNKKIIYYDNDAGQWVRGGEGIKPL